MKKSSGGNCGKCPKVYKSEKELVPAYRSHANGDIVFAEDSQHSFIKTKVGWAQINFDKILYDSSLFQDLVRSKLRTTRDASSRTRRELQAVQNAIAENDTPAKNATAN